MAAAAALDMRPYWLRNADALAFGFNSLLSDPSLGQHRGLPVTAVITMTLKDLEAATGKAISGGGTLIPIRDAIRMAAHAYQYLLVFDDDGRPLYLGRGTRLATADQRLVLYAGDRGCTFPGCPRPGYYCQTHHMDEWAAKHGCSDIDRLTFACEMHHRLIGPGPTQWVTTTAPPGGVFGLRTLWHPPAFMDPLRLGLVNHFHHPDEYLRETPDFPGPDGQPPPQRE
ncbi:HNH endonuclease signature motif containing protein [Tomitella biformata]|uniref:HNH endonuclease signature motif containing protein n=1 Tax=Tomitella biformata TaxID=630403 RepID=UPI00046777E6